MDTDTKHALDHVLMAAARYADRLDRYHARELLDEIEKVRADTSGQHADGVLRYAS